jgi:hypothetical protein
MQRVWVIRTKKQRNPYVAWLNLEGRDLYKKGDDPDNSGLIFGTKKQAERSLTRYDKRYRDDYEIVAYDMTFVEAS